MLRSKITGIRPGEKSHEQLYDGAAESATGTVHPGIIQLSMADNTLNAAEFWKWIAQVREKGISSSENPLRELLWNMTSN